MKGRNIISSILAAALALSCTVLEDRSACPCFLDVDYSRVLADNPFGSGAGAIAVSRGDGGLQLLHRAEFCPQVEEVRTGRGTYLFCMLMCGGEPVGDGLSVKVSAGSQCDSIYGYRTTVDATGETARLMVEVHKQFATVSVTDTHDGRALAPYQVVARGNSDGIDLTTLSPTKGDFFCRPQQSGGTYVFRMPRQADTGAAIELLTKTGGSLHHRLELGEALLEAGYDFGATDLEDITVTFDFDRMVALVKVADWEEETIAVIW